MTFVVTASLALQCAAVDASTGTRVVPPTLSHSVPRAAARAIRRMLSTTVGTAFISEGFSADTTTPGKWFTLGDTCLTAGDAATPATSIPACGSAAPRDAAGQGALQLTAAGASRVGLAIWNAPLATANGLQITFDDYTFDGTTPGSEGVVFFLTDAAKPMPTTHGQLGAGIGYSGTTTGPGLPNAYLGVALNEYGNFSNPAGGYTGGPGKIPETIAARGSAATNYQYLGGATNAAGQPASLPFALDQPAATVRPAGVPTIRATLTPADSSRSRSIVMMVSVSSCTIRRRSLASVASQRSPRTSILG